MNEKTIDYYNKNAKEFVGRTVGTDMGFCQKKFIELLEPGSLILDAGCGSGRDSKFFLGQGFRVQAIDASSKMCQMASEYTGLPVKCTRFEEIAYDSEFDGVWACASLLHVKKQELPDILWKFHKALKAGGIMYASFKYGNKEEERLERFFSDYKMDELKNVFLQDGLFELVQISKTKDARPDYEGKPWLNIIVRKN
ncbi:MAG: class I SAM-dependent methyltransferase [Roseburia sp.]|nr:class I SAM-dependent methyltransferase [Roseburia sp.]